MYQRFLVTACLFCSLALGSSAEAALVGYWSFDDAGNLGLNLVTGESLEAAGDAHQDAAGQSGGALALDGNGDYLFGVPPVPTDNSPYTISAWIKPTVTGNRGIAIGSASRAPGTWPATGPPACPIPSPTPPSTTAARPSSHRERPRPAR